MKIAIIGAGWFGCHLASELKNDGHSILLFEKEKDIFAGASGNNQNRLHLGYHYPRSYITREQSKKGFKLFKKNYPNFSNKIKKNLYGISNTKENILDFPTYLQILKSSNLPFEELDQKKHDLRNLSGLIKCEEEYISNDKAKKFFKKKLKHNIKYNFEVKNIIKRKKKISINNQYYDFLINTTWQQFRPSKEWELSYELCLSLLYKSKKKVSKAITIMDGPFYTLYPWSDKIFNLYSVKYSRFIVTKEFGKIKNKINKIKKNDLDLIRKKMEAEFKNYYPNFLKNYTFLKYIRTFRTIIDKKNHSRDYQINYKNRVFNVLSGKIDHIFLASKDIKKCLKDFS